MGSIAEDAGVPLMPVDTGDSPAAAVPIDAEAFPPPRQAWYTVGVLAVVTTFALLDQNILGLLIQQIKMDFGLTDSEAGLLLGPTQAIFYALVAVPFSRYIDRWTRKWIIAGGLIVWSLATAATGLASSFAQLFTARVVVGAGESINGPAAYSITADCFPRDRELYDPSVATTFRQRYYRLIYGAAEASLAAGGPVQGTNFWAWNGEARAQHPDHRFHEGDTQYMGDPPHEPQGWYGNFDSDAEMMTIIRNHANAFATA